MSTATKADTPKPQIVGWDDTPPPSSSSRKSMWDDVIIQVRAREDDKWAKVAKPPKWNSSSLSTLRKKHPDLQFENPTFERGRGAKAGEFLWIRKRVEGDEKDLPADVLEAMAKATEEVAAEDA